MCRAIRARWTLAWWTAGFISFRFGSRAVCWDQILTWWARAGSRLPEGIGTFLKFRAVLIIVICYTRSTDYFTYRLVLISSRNITGRAVFLINSIRTASMMTDIKWTIVNTCRGTSTYIRRDNVYCNFLISKLITKIVYENIWNKKKDGTICKFYTAWKKWIPVDLFLKWRKRCPR